MADTVLSMARSMLRGAISTATSAAAVEMSLLVGVRKDIWFIKDELETMQAFLEVAETMKNKDVLLKVWANQVRDLSYNIEDCLGEFIVHVGTQSLSRRLMKLKERHRIVMQIRDLKTRVEQVSIRNTRYNLIKTESSNTIGMKDSYAEDVRNHSASNLDDAELVGFSKPKGELIELMDVNNTDDCLAKVICIVGMGGLGKTTLARKTYESKQDIAKSFDCCAWITVSQSFSKIEMLKDMIGQLLGAASLKQCLDELGGKALRVVDLARYLVEELKEKRYFIVLDDLWTLDAWRWINDIAIPSTNNKGSRIIVTTRNLGLAKDITLERLIYHLKPLESQDATNILLKKSRKTLEDMEKNDSFKDIVQRLVKKCGCLPLALLTVGGVLATKKIAEWELVYDQLPSELETNINLQAMRQIVTLSYNHLPSHLKSCFLYLSIFPEDSEIKRRRLIERWIAKGFVRAKDGMAIQDVGISYFMELINRSMIQPSKVDIEGNIKSCRVHDIMRDIMISIAKDENFVYLAGDNLTRVMEENVRHVAYHGSKCQNIGIDWNHVLSIILFGERPVEPSPSVCSPDLRMLRALDLEDVDFGITQKNINNIGSLHHLKYVNLFYDKRYRSIYKLPRSIGKLQFLQTLDIRNTFISTLPNEISKLHFLLSLRCTKMSEYYYFDRDSPIRFLMNTLSLPMTLTPFADPYKRAYKIAYLHMAWSSRCSESEGVRIPKGFSNLKVLNVLEVVDVKRSSSKAIKELGELTRLSKLRVVTNGATEQKCKILCEAIEKLSSLRSLRIGEQTNYVGKLDWLHFFSSPPPLIRSLKLYGFLGEIPDWFGSLMHLVKIQLYESELEGGKTMEVLGTLPNLMLVVLYDNAYAGEQLVFREGAFQNLRKVDLGYSSGLREVRFEEGTSPHMEKIQFSGCRLESGIIGVKHLPKLTEISLYNGQVARLDALQGEVDAHPNRPVLRLNMDRSYHDLGEVVQGSTAPLQDEAATEEGEESSLHPDPSAAGESSSAQEVVVPTQSNSRDSEDDFCSCNSDADDGDHDA